MTIKRFYDTNKLRQYIYYNIGFNADLYCNGFEGSPKQLEHLCNYYTEHNLVTKHSLVTLATAINYNRGNRIDIETMGIVIQRIIDELTFSIVDMEEDDEG